MADALPTDAVAAAAADGRIGAGVAVVLLCGAVVTLGTLTARAQPPRVAQTDATLVGAIALVARRAGFLHLRLALAVALEVHGDLQRVLEAHRLYGEGLAHVCGTATSPGLHAERHLQGLAGASRKQARTAVVSRQFESSETRLPFPRSRQNIPKGFGEIYQTIR